MENHATELATSYNQLKGLIRQARARTEYEISCKRIVSVFLGMGLVNLKKTPLTGLPYRHPAGSRCGL